MEWISINDRMPEINEHDEEYPNASDMILLSDREFVYYGQYEKSLEFGESFIDSNGDDFSDDGIDILWWMKLPEPPRK